jgi:microsomal dipeptidase-like Zn-dependent dipeptidase
LKDHNRNYRDDQLTACGGIACINSASRFLNDSNASATSMVEAVDYAVQ